MHPWLSVKTEAEFAGIVIQRVSYRSGPLTIRGEICRPISGGRHPLLVWNHGGASGVEDAAETDRPCVRFARFGWVVAESSYRGEDGSDGHIELCLGEVDDVLSMLRIARTQRYVDSGRTVMMGESHGGCITSRAVARGADVDLAVDMYGPTDWGELVNPPAGRSGPHAPGWKPDQQALAGALKPLIGGESDQSAERYAERSPDPTKMAQWRHPLLILHGSADPLVPVAQSCALAAAIDGVKVAQLKASGAMQRRLPRSCRKLRLERAQRPLRSFNSDRYLLLYAGVGHNGFARMFNDVAKFIEVKLGCLSACTPAQDGL